MSPLTLSFHDLERAFARADRWPEELPPLLFHYTSAESLLGILETDSLWASQIRYLNDAAELLYAAELIVDVVDGRISRCHHSNRRVLETVRDTLPRLEYERFLYATSFSEDGDLLSQWRAYGDAGGGYAVGVRMREVLPDVPGPVVRKVEYEEKKQRELVQNVLSAFLEGEDPEPRDRPQRDSLAVALMADLALAGAFFKHGSFHEEREWRALSIAAEEDGAISFRASGGIIVPFFPVSFPSGEDAGSSRLPLGLVTCGPTLQPTLSRRAVTLALRLQGKRDCEVRSSRVPLRWPSM